VLSGITKSICDLLVQGLFRGIYKLDWLIFPRFRMKQRGL